MGVLSSAYRAQNDRRWHEPAPNVNMASSQAVGLVALCDARGPVPVELITKRPSAGGQPPALVTNPEHGLASQGGNNLFCTWAVPPTLQAATNASVSAWVSKKTGESCAVCVTGAGGNGRRFGFLWFTSGVLFCLAETTATAYRSVTLGDNGSFHIVMTYDGNKAVAEDRVTLFVNGVLTNFTGSSGTIPAALYSAFLGIDWHRDISASVYRYANGTIWNSAWYNRTLTAGEASGLYSPHSRWDLYGRRATTYAPIFSKARFDDSHQIIGGPM